MKRPMCAIGFPFGIAVWAAFFFDADNAAPLSVAALVTAVLVYLVGKRKRYIAACAALLSCAAAFAWFGLYHARSIAPFERAAGRSVTLEGFVREVSIGGRWVRYTLDARFPKVPLPDCGFELTAFGESQAEAGDTIRCGVIIDPEVSAYNRNNGISARGLIDGELVRLAPEGISVAGETALMREAFEKNVTANLPQETAGIVGVMVMRLGGRADSDTYTHMNRSGISHLLSISGLHFSVLSAAVFGVLRKLGLPRRVPELLTMALCFAFVALTGFSASIVRAFVMFLVMMLGLMSYRRGDGLNSLGLAVLVLAVFRPAWMLSVGTWLSVCSTMGILMASRRVGEIIYRRLSVPGHKRLDKAAKALSSTAGVSLSAYIFTMPILFVNGGWISLVALPANILVAPFTAPLLVCGMLCALLPAGTPGIEIAAGISDFCARAIRSVSETLSRLPFATISLDESWMLIWITAVIIIAVLIVRWKPEKSIAAFGALLIVFSFSAGALSARAGNIGKIELIALENCASALLLRNGEAVLIGTPGPYDASLLLPYLEYRNVREISAAVVPDSGDSVSSGLARLRSRCDIRLVIGPDDAYIVDQLARSLKGVTVYPSDNLTLEVLGGARISFDEKGGVAVTAGTDSFVKRPSAPLSPPQNLRPLPEFLGNYLYGEIRWQLEV